VQICAPDDGRRNRLKHVEQFVEINKSRNVASCWLYIGKSLHSLREFHLSITTLSPGAHIIHNNRSSSTSVSYNFSAPIHFRISAS
jgi:hypothetical protein